MTLPSWWKHPKPYAIMDCLEGMKDIPDKSVDLVLTDPPYALGMDYGETYEDTEENLIILISRFMPEVLRISKVALITPGYNNIYKYPKPDHILAWCYFPGHTYSKWGFSAWQPILAYGKDPYLTNGMGCRDDAFHETDKISLDGHPCPKADLVWEKILIRGSVREGDIVLDPFLGSGTTLNSCRKNKRIGLGFEINPDYEPIIQKRMMEDIPELERWF